MAMKDKYVIQQKIGEGSFGRIFQAAHKITGEKVAVKINYGENDNVILKNEARIYTILSDIKGVPNMRNFGMDGSYNFMVLDILGPSLLDLKNDYGHPEKILHRPKEECLKKTLSLKTVLSLGLQMLRRIECIHNKGFLHRDIKPDNFLFGSEKHPHVLYIIDFGLAKKYCKYIDKDDQTGNDIDHIPCETGRNITGTERYVSVNVHDGLTPSRRDDMESIGYVMIFLFIGYLPWSSTAIVSNSNSNNSNSNNSNSNNSNNILDKKKETDLVRSMKQRVSHWMLENKLPTEFIAYIEYCRSLKFKEKPDYNYLRTLLLNLFKHKQFTVDNNFEWNTHKQTPQNDIS
tara:strand:- start:8208 stop:9245 length:1038 start_codon:yes stop_codon:yes gene_type:complete